MALMIASFDHTKEAEIALDLVDSVAVRRNRALPLFGVVSGGEAATTAMVSDPTRLSSSVGGLLLQVLANLSRATPATPGVSGVVWGLAARVGRAAIDNPAMWALSRAFDCERPSLVGLADAKDMAALQEETLVESAELHEVPDATYSLVTLMADLPIADLTRRPVLAG